MLKVNGPNLVKFHNTHLTSEMDCNLVDAKDQIVNFSHIPMAKDHNAMDNKHNVMSKTYVTNYQK